MFDTAVCDDDDRVVYGEGAGALYEGGIADGIGAGGSGDEDIEVVDVVDPRISYNADGGTAYEGCIDE